MSRCPRVTVVMRSKNCEWVIAQALKALFSQHFTDFELLVVDSGSTDRTLEVVAQYPARVIRIAPDDYFPGRVLNAAIREARADLIVFQNSDVVPLDASALGRLVAAFDDPAVGAAFARQVPRPEADTWVRRDYEVSFPASGEAPPWITLSLPLAAMRRSAWERHAFYDAAWGSEDTEWGAWARDNGLAVRYVADSVVMHSHNYTLRQLYGRRFIEGEADAFIYDRRESLVRMLGHAAMAMLRDVMPHVRARDWRGLLETPARRLVYAWAYHKGWCHGDARRRKGDADAAFGQQVVLQRHESVVAAT